MDARLSGLSGDDDLSALVSEAARAANAHNTQPWSVDRQGDELVLRRDRARTLGASDPRGRDTMLSFGAFVESLLVCAASAGVGLGFEASTGGDAETDEVGRFSRHPEGYQTRFSSADVRGRRVWRGRWRDGGPGPDLLQEAAVETERMGFRLVSMPTRDARPILVRANRWFFGEQATVAELDQWTRLSPRHPRYDEDGLNDAMLVLSKVERVGLRTLIGPRVFRALRGLGLPGLLARMSASATQGSGTVLGVVGPAGAQQELAAGRLLTRLWLGFQRHGLYVHPQSAPLDCPETRAMLDERWQVAPDEQLVAWFRVGIPASDPTARVASPRRSGG
ncbi:hypothetical protein SAMN06295974_1574 [Plantibacter flavus]|uniref:Nitroreductase family protein n=1 Tax=Plantibacter flavus TaxID=150123 RepID=A0A3N2C7L5_9MICO|nr:hypothetical protein [Plantibacter flavus]ROR83505.1 hypothetical protein EDD42_3617 [Plantibacter flavus]SMG24242.1 hypothetical protein SAMN06295974_1574 [Plantibacter flavus]